MMLGMVLCQCLVSVLLAQAIALHSLFLHVLLLSVLLNKGMAESKQDMLRSAFLQHECVSCSANRTQAVYNFCLDSLAQLTQIFCQVFLAEGPSQAAAKSLQNFGLEQ